MTTRRLEPGAPFHFLIADLKGSKDTRRILHDLNTAFINGSRPIRKALGEENHRIVTRAVEALSEGDARTLGDLMNEAQSIFDDLVAPYCPSQLASPRLHETLGSEHALRLAWGGKGVGSQGDGTAQFICRGPEEREELAGILELSGLQCYSLTI
jgi:mevalonate kinase